MSKEKVLNSKNDLKDINVPEFLEKSRDAQTVNVPENITVVNKYVFPSKSKMIISAAFFGLVFGIFFFAPAFILFKLI